MPTDLVALPARKRAARAQVRNEAKLVLAWCGICLLIVEMLFASHAFEQAVILMGRT
jgi:hypothetical protein